MNLKYIIKKPVALIALATALSACAEDSNQDLEWSYGDTFALNGALVIHDSAQNRFTVIQAETETRPSIRQVDAGTNVITATTSADNRYLYSLSGGVVPRKFPSDPAPELRIIDGKADSPQATKVYQLDEPMTRLAVDPKGDWVAAFAGSAEISNPSEIILVKLSGDADDADDLQDAITNLTIRAFAGQPKQLIFTDDLTLPGNEKTRFLIVATDRDLTLINLNQLDQPEITIPMPIQADGSAGEPNEVIFNDGDADNESDARLAISIRNSPEILIVQLNDASGDLISINSVDVGGEPSQIAFLKTAGGLKLTALVPELRQAALINPDTSVTTKVDLPGSYEKFSLVTDALEETDEEAYDTALLWGGARSISFWSLSAASDTPYRSLSTTMLSFDVFEVLDVPAPSEHLKVIKGFDSNIFILDLQRRESSPITAAGYENDLSVSSNGKHLWITPEAASSFSQISLENLHPTSVYTPQPIDKLHELNTKDGKRALFTLVQNDNRVDLNIYNAESPDYLNSYYFPALNLRDLP